MPPRSRKKEEPVEPRPATKEGRLTRLRARAAEANKKYGEGTVVIASDIIAPPPSLSTGSTAFDIALGGGWPANQWNEIIGVESSGKTLACLQTIAAAQRVDPDFWTVWLAAEGYDLGYAELCGVDNSRVIVVNSNIMEEAYQAALDYIESHDVDLVVVDSLPALSPQNEWDRDLDQRSPGLGAFVTGLFFRKSYKATKRSLVVEERPIYGLMINQYRSKIGVMYGDPRTTPGGEAKNYRFYTRVEVKRDEFITTKARGEGEKVGQTVKYRVIKNKAAPPQQVAVVDFYFRGFGEHEAGRYDRVKEIASLAMALDVVQFRGSYAVFGEDRFKGGRQGLYDALDDVAFRDRLTKAVMDTIGESPKIVLPDDPEMAAAEAEDARLQQQRFAERVEGAVGGADDEESEEPGDDEARERAQARRSRAPAKKSTATVVKRKR